MKSPRARLHWIDAAAVLALAGVTAALWTALVRPALDVRTREDQLRARLAAMRGNLSTLRGRAREFEVRVESARQVVDGQPALEPFEALLTRRAAITALLAEHNLLLDEFETRRDKQTAAAGRRAAPAEPPQAPAAPDGFSRHTLTLRGEGTFPDLVSMTSHLRAEFPDTAIQAIEVSGQPLGSSDQRRFTLSLVWYTSPDETP